MGKEHFEKISVGSNSTVIIFVIDPVDYNHLSIIEQFHKQSFFWDYLLNFDGIRSLILLSVEIILCF
jgi:hypothetical protein